MFCSKCGFKLPEGYKFCPKCGTPVRGKEANGIKIVQMKCQDCNGIMDVDEDKQILFCPYCGSKKLILENDDVIIEKIRSSAELEKERIHKDVELAKQSHEIKVKKHDFKEEILSIILVVIAIIFFMFVFRYFVNP